VTENLKRILVLGTSLLFATSCTTLQEAVRPDDGCLRVTSLSRAGEHMAAVGAAKSLKSGIDSCPAETLDSLETSMKIVERADALVRSALEKKSRGELAAARLELQEALEIYPRYYWVMKLQRGLENSINAPNTLMEEAQRLEAGGDYSAAAEKVRAALELKPDDKDLRSRLSVLEEKAGPQKLRERARLGLDRAVKLAAGGRYGEAETLLEQSRANDFFKEEAGQLLAQIERSRYARSKSALALAQKASERGDLDEAIFHVESAVALGPLKEPLKSEFTDFARRLGMQLFSRGELSSASVVWSLGLENDPGNEVLSQYMKEVEQRLENLKRIQDEERVRKPDSGPR